MGYTHYWSIPAKGVPQKDWDAAIADIKDIVHRHKDVLQHEYDEPDTEPEVTSDRIFFNGIGDDGHETFVVDRRLEDYEFCKTARKPYDQAVCECLLVLKARITGFSLRSDGFSAYLEDPVMDGEWPAAMEAVKQYGLHYEPYVANERSPYCDLALRLREVDGESLC